MGAGKPEFGAAKVVLVSGFIVRRGMRCRERYRGREREQKKENEREEDEKEVF